MALEAGNLRVMLHYAKDLKDCDWFGRQDPYARVKVGNQERRSRVCRDGGRNPVWDQTFDFSIINENAIDITLMDEDTLSRDDLIGTATVGLAKVRMQGQDIVEAPVSDGKKVHKQLGFIKISLVFTPNTNALPTHPYPMPSHQPAMPPQTAAAPYGYAFPQPAAYSTQYAPAPSQYYAPPYGAPPAYPGCPSASGYGAPSAPVAPPPAAPPAAPSYYPAIPDAPPSYGAPYGAAQSYRS